VRENSRKTDTVAGYGGEELILLLPGTDSAAARLVGEKRRAAAAAPAVDVGPKELSVTVSVGAAVLHPAKRAGKNRVELHAAGGAKRLPRGARHDRRLRAGRLRCLSNLGS
jgi:diguanylate cyclase (GGDEF)-like protein